MGKKAQRWEYSVGERPNTVTVYERRPGGSLYVRVWDPTARGGRGNWVRRSLKHSSREQAKTYAHDQYAKLRVGEAELAQGTVTLGHLFALYKRFRTPQKGAKEQKADARRTEMWSRVLGAGHDPEKISRAAWERFVEARRSGAIDARGEPIPEKKRRTVGARVVERDQRFLLAVLNWGVDWRTEDGYLLSENCCRGFRVEEEKNPSRPVATDVRVDAVRGVYERVAMEVTWGGKRKAVPSHLPCVFDLLVETGRRLSAVLGLRYSDLALERGPHGAISWPADTDKEGEEHRNVPITARARQALDRHAARMRRLGLPGIGDAPLFPSPKDPSKPVDRHKADRWLRKAEDLAELEPQEGSLFHAYRRRWATVRKHLPAVDVAEAGGWAGPETLQHCYQHADQETMLRVVLEGGRLEEATGS